MTSESNVRLLWRQFWAELLVYLGRPSVQIQIAVAVVAILASYVLGQRIRKGWRKRVPPPGETATFGRKFIYHTVDQMTSGILAVLLMQLGKGMLGLMAVRTQLLDALAGIVLLYLLLKAALALILAVGSGTGVRRYRGVLIIPLFTVVLGMRLLDIFFHNGRIWSTPVFVLFGSPIALSVLLLVTVGFYLWVVGIYAMGQGIHFLTTRYAGADEGSAQALLTLLRYLLIILGLGYVLYRLNFDPTTIAAITGGLSVGVGFALSTILSNFVSGLLILFERTLRPGDVIEMNGELSTVDAINIRSVRAHTPDNVEKIIPNSDFITSPFTTYTGKSRHIRLKLPVGVSYDDDHRDVIPILLAIADTSSRVMKEPAPAVRVQNLGDFAIEYVLEVWVANPLLSAKVRSELYQAILSAFAEKGVTIPYPTVVVESGAVA